MTDQEAREAIMKQFFKAYLKGGLHIILQAGAVAKDLDLEPEQARRCMDYLEVRRFIRAMTLGGGYSPTVELIDAVEEKQGSRDG